MKKIYRGYPTGGFHPTIKNLCETNFYLTEVFYNYIGREEIFSKAEVLIIGHPEELEYGKYIPDKYIGLIKNMGIMFAKYIDEDNIFCEQIEVIRGERLTGESIKNFKKCFLEQCHIFDHFDAWKSGTKIVFMELYKVVPNFSNILYRQKQLYDLYLDFDQNGDLVKEIELKKFFKITENVFYDLEKHLFVKDGEEIPFSPYNSLCKQKFLETLMISSPGKILKEKLFDILNLDNKKLLEMKRSLLIFEFEKYLGLKKEFVEKHILIAEKNKGYMIVGEFIEF